LKTGKRLLVFRYIVGQEFQRNKAMQPGVLGFVDNAHSSTAKFFKNAVVGESLAYERVDAGHVPLILGPARRQVNEDTKTNPRQIQPDSW